VEQRNHGRRRPYYFRELHCAYYEGFTRDGRRGETLASGLKYSAERRAQRSWKQARKGTRLFGRDESSRYYATQALESGKHKFRFQGSKKGGRKLSWGIMEEWEGHG